MTTFLYHLSIPLSLAALLFVSWMIYCGWRQGEEMSDEEFDDWSRM